ncbi:AMP-binding protein [Rhodococcus pyridinivorans]|nr:AMP-binding protein [Rhodococcus pyridinivorans]
MIAPAALAYREGDTPVVWSQACVRIASLAAALRRSGLQPGDRVATLSGNSARHLEAIYATWWAGGIVVPVNTRLAHGEIRYILDHSGSTLLLADGENHADAERVAALSQSAIGVVNLDEDDRYNEMLCNEAIPDTYPAADSTAGIFYTGGTTGTPKGVELTHANFLFAAMGANREIRLDHKSVYQHAAPLFHLADFCIGNGVTLAAGTHSFVEKFSPESFYNGLREDKVTHVCLVPTMLATVLDAEIRDDALLKQVESITYGAAPISTSLLKQVIATFPSARLQQFYGMTECCGASTVLVSERHVDGPDGPAKLDSAGRPFLGCELRVVDTDFEDVVSGTAGEIVMRGPHIMRGYWNDPTRTEDVFKDGWLRSGDVGVLDEEGFVHVVDRLKDMIVTGGENVYSGEVENALATHPAVTHCAVVGVPDERWGECVHAVVVVRPDSDADANTFDTYLRERIAGYKVPRSYELNRTELPLTAVGKIRKSVLREEWTISNG